MVSSALATQRCFWSELRHRSTLAVYAPSCALSDSRQLVVFRLMPRGPTRPSRCRVRVSSRPSSRRLTADSLTSVNSLRSRSRAAVASASVGRS